MRSQMYRSYLATIAAILAATAAIVSCDIGPEGRLPPVKIGNVDVHHALLHDTSPTMLAMLGMPEAPQLAAEDPDQDQDADADEEEARERKEHGWALFPQATQTQAEAPPRTVPKGSAEVEQTVQGTKAAPAILASFDGMGFGFDGPQGSTRFNNPSDNSLAVGPDHIVQIVNTRMAVYTKKGAKYDTTGKILYGPVNTNNVFKGFGDAATINSGDSVVRYDQLADRWLIVMPIFRRLPLRKTEPTAGRAGEPATRSWPGVATQPGEAREIDQPRAREADTGPATSATATATRGGRGGRGGAAAAQGSYAMCYAVSTTSDPLGSYYRYEFIRPLFPDYPRPAVWPDGYYVPTSTGDTVIQKQAFVADREKMLRGLDATEQGVIIDGINFLNNADVDGKLLPPPGAPNIMLAAGGSQLRHVLEDDGIYSYTFHVDWNDPLKTKVEGPAKILVAPYHYMGDGQLTNAVPQPGTTRGLDAQGDKIMQRVVYRRIGDHESLLAVHSINTSAGGGGVRWYEFRLDEQRTPKLFQQGTYCPEGSFRWMASPAMDALGNIGIGYSFGGTPNFAGQRFAGRQAADPLGQMTLHEAVLAEGHAAQTSTNRWEDYATTCMDPSDDRTMWYVGDYLKEGATAYASRIGAFRIGN